MWYQDTRESELSISVQRKLSRETPVALAAVSALMSLKTHPLESAPWTAGRWLHPAGIQSLDLIQPENLTQLFKEFNMYSLFISAETKRRISFDNVPRR